MKRLVSVLALLVVGVFVLGAKAQTTGTYTITVGTVCNDNFRSDFLSAISSCLLPATQPTGGGTTASGYFQSWLFHYQSPVDKAQYCDPGSGA